MSRSYVEIDLDAIVPRSRVFSRGAVLSRFDRLVRLAELYGYREEARKILVFRGLLAEDEEDLALVLDIFRDWATIALASVSRDGGRSVIVFESEWVSVDPATGGPYDARDPLPNAEDGK